VSKESRRAGRSATRSGAEPTSAGPSGSPRAGRRDRPRYVERKSFVERNRNLLVSGVIVAVIAVVGGLIFLQATQPAYACTSVWKPDPTPSPAAGASNRIGYLQPDMGNTHVNIGKSVKYAYCPPASGEHVNVAGVGPISPARIFKPDDKAIPEQWIHNLEHGGLVILYRGDSPGATAAGLASFQTFFDAFPTSPICQVAPHKLSPIVARFDQMATPFAALVWDRVLPMDTWDPALATQFYLTEAERKDSDGKFVAPPEWQAICDPALQSAPPTESPGPSVIASGSAAPSAAAPSAAAPSSAPSVSPEPSAAPS
jgi:hypothetical protein